MSRRSIAAVLVLLLLAPATARAEKKTWKDHVTSAGGSALLWAGEKVLNQIAAGLYGLKCKDGKPAKNQPSTSVDELVCSVAGDMSGRSEADWQASVSRDLQEIKGQLDEVLQGQKDLNDALNRQSRALRQAFADLPTKIGTQNSLTEIQVAWGLFNDFYAKSRAGRSPAQVQQLQRDVARKLLDSHRVDEHARRLRTLIIDGADNEPPLPMLLAREIDQWTRAAHPVKAWDYQDPQCKKGGPYPCLDLLGVYEGLETAMKTWLLREKQAQVMNLWAHQTLGTGVGLAEFESASHEDSLEVQLASFEGAVEWLVLAYSAPRSPFADFLTEGSAEAFARVDALKALHLSSRIAPRQAAEGRAIWGRVIGMGDSFSGELAVGVPGEGKSALQAQRIGRNPFAEHAVQGFDGELDWWTASNPRTPEAYDTPHFAKTWRVYRFKLPLGANAPAGDYALTAKQFLPVLPATVPVDAKTLGDLAGQPIPFASFVGIARAGGGYALFSGEFVPDEVDRWGDVGEFAKSIAKKGALSNVERRGSMPRVALGDKASTKHVVKPGPNPRQNVPVSFGIDRWVVLRRVSTKKVRTADGGSGTFDLHALWNGDDMGARDLGAAGDRPVDMTNDWNAFEMGWMQKAEYKVSVGVVLGYLESNPGNGVELTRTGKNDEQATEWVVRKAGDHDCKGAATKPPVFMPVSVGAELRLKLPEVYHERSWAMLAKTPLQTAYLTRAGGPTPCP